MDASLNEFLKYYNDFIKKNGFEPTAYDVNFWIINFFKSKKKNETFPKKDKKIKNDL